MNHEQPDRRAWRTGAEWERLRERMALADAVPQPRRRIPAYVWTAVAAAIVLAIVIPLRARPSARPAAEPHVYSTAAGERPVVHLSDSSVVALGPATTLRFTAGDKRRNAELL